MQANFLTISEMTEEQAREYLENIRWGEHGAKCPHCKSEEAYKLEGKATRSGLYKCKKCRKQFTVTVGTIFHGSRIPIKKWLLAIYLMCASKKGISAHQIHRQLGITYKSAWFMCHRIRTAMEENPEGFLTGEVEVDETYIGGKRKGKRGRGAEGKTPVVALIERGGELRAQKVNRLSAQKLKGIIKQNVAVTANINTDEFRSYNGLDKTYANHNTVKHYSGEFVNGTAHTNTLEGWFSLLKRGVNGTFHHVSEKHLHRYINEFVFRYNNRKSDDAIRSMLAIGQTGDKRLSYYQTTSDD
jgi:transposase-like protein